MLALQFMVVPGSRRATFDLSETGSSTFYKEDESRLYGQRKRLGLLVLHDLGGMPIPFALIILSSRFSRKKKRHRL